jgi:CrcB protein
MTRLALVALGGGAGALARYVIGAWIATHLASTFPWGTLAVNVAGSFLIGVVAVLADEAGRIGPDLRVLLIAGVLGGFTTFSSFSMETFRLIEHGDLARGLLNVAANLALCGVAVALGVVLGRTL